MSPKSFDISSNREPRLIPGGQLSVQTIMPVVRRGRIEAASRPHPNSDKAEDKNRYASSVRAGACARHRRRDRSALDRLAASAPCPCRRRKSAPSGLRAGNSRMTDRTPGQTLQIDAIHRTRRRESTIRREARAAHSEISGRQLDWLALAGERKGGHNIARVEGKPTSVDRHVPDDHAGSALALVHSFLSARAVGRPPIDATSAPPMPGEYVSSHPSVDQPGANVSQGGDVTRARTPRGHYRIAERIVRINGLSQRPARRRNIISYQTPGSRAGPLFDSPTPDEAPVMSTTL